MSTVATTHWKLPFCITLHLDDVFGAVVWGEYGFEFDFSDGEDKGKSLCKRRFNSIQFYLNTVKFIRNTFNK